MQNNKTVCSTFAGPYVMKLFDRSVDLAPFTDETPLYPICRAWMENDPLKKNAHQQSNGVNHGELRIEADSVSGTFVFMRHPSRTSIVTQSSNFFFYVQVQLVHAFVFAFVFIRIRTYNNVTRWQKFCRF